MGVRGALKSTLNLITAERLFKFFNILKREFICRRVKELEGYTKRVQVFGSSSFRNLATTIDFAQCEFLDESNQFSASRSRNPPFCNLLEAGFHTWIGYLDNVHHA